VPIAWLSGKQTVHTVTAARTGQSLRTALMAANSSCTTDKNRGRIRPPSRMTVNVLRFVVLFAGMLLGLVVLYRYAPDRERARWSWVTPESLFATVVWIIGSLLFSFYAANFGRYNETYGALGAVIVVILWLLSSALVVILGAELNCELERQTVRDTTKGPERPLGRRHAYVADTVGPAADTA
jgi:uncharacterized BrkB/YihY/UPF0761 family membrane protein